MTRSTWCVDECDGEALLSFEIRCRDLLESPVEFEHSCRDSPRSPRRQRAAQTETRRTREVPKDSRASRASYRRGRAYDRACHGSGVPRSEAWSRPAEASAVHREISASGSARGGCGLKARGSRRTPAVPRDGPASSGNHDEDIRLRRAVPVQALRVSAGARRAIHLSRVLNIRGTPRPSQPFPHPLTEPSFTVRASWARCSRLRTRVRTRCWSHPRDPASPSRCCAQVRKPAAPVSPDRCTPL